MSVSTFVLVGNPRPASRTLAVAQLLGRRLADISGARSVHTLDLAELGPRLFDQADAGVAAEIAELRTSPVAVVASPTYKASFSGLLKLFLDRIPAGALSDTLIVPLMTGGAANHALAVEVHLRPVLLELGAVMPTRGLYVLESQLAEAESVIEAWEHESVPALAAFRKSLPVTP